MRCLLASLVAFIVLPIMALPVYAEVKIDSFSPSVGWAGTDDSNGTLVKIKGTGFYSEIIGNNVFFTDESNYQWQGAKVEFVLADGAKYSFTRTIGSPVYLKNPIDIAVDGENGDIYVANYDNKRIEVFKSDGTWKGVIGWGSLEFPWSVALDKDKVYVSDEKSTPSNSRIAVFNKKDGKELNPIGRGRLTHPRDLAVDQTGHVYVIDQIEAEKAYCIKLDPYGEEIFRLRGPDNNPFGELAGLALDLTGFPATYIYLTDRKSRTIWKYNYLGMGLAHKNLSDLDPTYVRPESVVVDWQGMVYVEVGDGVIAKLDSSLNQVAEIDLLPEGGDKNMRAMDKMKTIYTIDRIDNYLSLFSPADTGELWVRVPPGAKTGPIKVVSAGSGQDTKGTFTVLDVSGTPKVTKVEVTQGLSSYPLVTGKPTLVFAMIDGLFGAPGRDTAEVCFAPPGSICISVPFDRYTWDYGNKKTTAYYHVPENLIRHTGKYYVSVRLKRDTTMLYDDHFERDAWSTPPQGILFVPFTGFNPGQWAQDPPFSWLDMKALLYAVATFGRVYPVDPQNVMFRISEGQYAWSLNDGKVETVDELSELADSARIVLNRSGQGLPNSRKAVALVDSKLRQIPDDVWGAAPFNNDHAAVFGLGGPIVVHELGHSYGLVSKEQANYYKQDGHHHSRNSDFSNEEGAPIMVWSSLTDELLPGSGWMVATIMKPSTGGIADWVFFESRVKDDQGNFQGVDYPILMDKFGKTQSASSARMLSALGGNAQLASSKFVIVGAITMDGMVLIRESYLTNEDIPLTPVEAGDYSVVFRNNAGEILSTETFGVSFEIPDSIRPLNRAPLNLVLPYPTDATMVEIRFMNYVLKTLVRSKNSPVVFGVNVQLQGTSFPVISWNGGDADGDPLTYALYYSVDGGETFIPIAGGLSETTYVWYDRLTGGGANALVKVEASDGFNVGSAFSAGFSLPRKTPQPVIMFPNDGSTFTEGSLIRLRGTAFDPEDGLLARERLTWQLDDKIVLGQGETILLQDLLHTVPAGTFPFPLEVGVHSIRLVAKDSDGNEVSTSISINVVADADRDGFSDEEEAAAGGNPQDPFIRPNRAPVSDPGGPYVVSAGATVGLNGTGSTDPDGDLLSFVWDFGDGTTGGGAIVAHRYASGCNHVYNVSLTVRDPFDLNDTNSTTVTVVDTTPPTISSVKTAPSILWPPDHKMVPVTVKVDASDNCAVARCRIISATSSEPDNGLGDGDIAGDIQTTGDLTLLLRAERSGTGKGRIYAIRINCADIAGNSTERVVEVKVPHSK